MKKTMIFAAIAALVGIGFTSCNKSDDDAAQVSKYITVSANVGNLSRVITNQDGSQSFAKGDQISVYAWTGSNAAVSGLIVNGAVNTFDGSKWAAAPMMLWKDMITPHFFIGVYPARTITDFTADAFTLGTDQTANDLLAANVLGAGRLPKDGVVTMTFDHMMAKLVVNLTFRNQWTTTPTVEKVEVPATSMATVNYLTKAVTAGTEKANVAIPVATANTAYAGIMVPQTINQVFITIDGHAYTYTNAEGITLPQGTVRTINLIVGRNQIELGSVSINNWITGEEIPGGEALN